jgi:hypothetical protein
MSGEPETLAEARRADRVLRRSDQLLTLAGGRAAIEHEIEKTVLGLRRDGVSWRTIAMLLGVSAQAAQQRYSVKKT